MASSELLGGRLGRGPGPRRRAYSAAARHPGGQEVHQRRAFTIRYRVVGMDPAPRLGHRRRRKRPRRATDAPGLGAVTEGSMSGCRRSVLLQADDQKGTDPCRSDDSGVPRCAVSTKITPKPTDSTAGQVIARLSLPLGMSVSASVAAIRWLIPTAMPMSIWWYGSQPEMGALSRDSCCTIKMRLRQTTGSKILSWSDAVITTSITTQSAAET